LYAIIIIFIRHKGQWGEGGSFCLVDEVREILTGERHLSWILEVEQGDGIEKGVGRNFQAKHRTHRGLG
jgi:hypothetical protein